MFRIAFVLSLYIALPVVSHGHREKCGTKPMDENEREAVRKAVDSFRRRGARREAITIPTCFHVLYPVGGEDGEQNLDDVTLQAQLDQLNNAFSASSCCDTNESWCTEGTCSVDTGITFAMAEVVDGAVTGNTVASITDSNACVTRSANDEWAVDADTDGMQDALKQGGSETLNVYFVDFDLLGYASFDLVVNAYDSLPGFEGSYGEGDTLVHEVGHWLGLPHTFVGGCSLSDGITDTPAEAEAYFGCSPDTNPDTCPNNPGIDPIHNFMDYSDDLCLYEFTQGQMEIMQAFYDYLRLENNDVDNEISLELAVPSDPISMLTDTTQIFSLITTKCCVVCQTESSEGDADLFVQLGSVPEFDAEFDVCASELEGSYEECTITRNSNSEITTGRAGGFYAATCFGDGGGDVDDDDSPPSCDGSDDSCESIQIYIGVLAYDSHLTDLTVTCL